MQRGSVRILLAPQFSKEVNNAYNCIMSINLKKYSTENLTDFDLEYVRVDDELNMKYYLDVMLNGKKIGELHVHAKNNGSDRQVNFKSTDDKSPIKDFNYYSDLQKAKNYIQLQMLNIATFINKHYGND